MLQVLDFGIGGLQQTAWKVLVWDARLLLLFGKVNIFVLDSVPQVASEDFDTRSACSSELSDQSRGELAQFPEYIPVLVHNTDCICDQRQSQFCFPLKVMSWQY